MSGDLRRLGLNLLYLVPGEVGGTEVYASNFIREIARLRPDLEVVAYVGPEARDWVAQSAPEATVETVVSPVRSRAKPLRALAEQTWLPRRARRDGIDLLHSLGTTAPATCPIPSVVTIHDLIYRHFPETFPPAGRLGLRALVPLGARRADRVFADSRAGRDDICASLGIEAAKVDAVHLGCGRPPEADPAPRDDLAVRYGLGQGPLVLTVSAALAHKNLPRLIEAFARVARTRDATLALIGHSGRELERLKALAAGHGVGDRVIFTGWVSDRDLEGFYEAADVFAYPSLMEGFGMPILEAMQRRLAVACSNASALPEVAGDAAELFDPLDPVSIAAAITRLLDDSTRRSELVERGASRPAAFTWESTVRETLDGYRRVLEPAPRPAQVRAFTASR